MATSEQFDRYTEVLRPLMPYVGDGPLDRSSRLPDLGLDSLGIIQALVEIEAEFGIEFPDDWLTADTFETVGSLWAAVSSLIEPERSHVV